MKYTIEVNRCGCHPESCCCDDYVILDPEGEEFVTVYKRADGDLIVEALNFQLANKKPKRPKK
jgi:hypothetical protein